MIKKTHSVKSLSDARDSEGSPYVGEADSENEWGKENSGRHGDSKTAPRRPERLSAAVIYIH